MQADSIINIRLKSKLHYKISQNSLGTLISEREVPHENVIGRKQCHAINNQSEDRLRSNIAPSQELVVQWFWHVQKSCQNSRTFPSKKIILNLSNELPEVEDGENTVLLLCPPVKIGNGPNKTQAVTKNKSTAILAKRMHPIILWWLMN